MSARQPSASGPSGASFNFSRALAAVDPTVVALFGPKLGATATLEFQAIAAAVIAEDFGTVQRLSETWGAVFESMGAVPLVAHARQLRDFAEVKDAARIAHAMGPMRIDLMHFCQSLAAALDQSTSGVWQGHAD